MKQYYVYILTNKKFGILYVGYTNDIQRRMHEHKNREVEGFTSKYKIDRLVYFETYVSIQEAQIREKRLKKWNKKWKIKLIEKMNPEWQDLSKTIGRKLSATEKLKLLFEKRETEL